MLTLFEGYNLLLPTQNNISVIVVSPDINVFSVALNRSTIIPSNVYVETGNQTNLRLKSLDLDLITSLSGALLLSDLSFYRYALRNPMLCNLFSITQILRQYSFHLRCDSSPHFAKFRTLYISPMGFPTSTKVHVVTSVG